ncbi:hypothetical protein EYC80_003666 [Monilinia laxa]|uniref:Uncharacterized protein n=1 Tax=Monilinia laxa TaxID=61186 RepID=A0A5N6KKC6_MONLA|nr:hypothetical protein EYC80_003666 [Monilinia laxa]
MTEPKSPNFIISKWGIGWETPTIMISCYLLALIMALLHLWLFIYISGKNADGSDRVAPQTYISTSSNILANAFSFFLKTALATAFIQYLWHLLRVQTMTVSTIEALFGLKSNLFQMFTGATIRAAPVLCVLSVIMTSMGVAVSFPPGAINVVSVQRTSYNPVVVPTFNASFMGNGSGYAANHYSLATLSPISESADGSVSGFTSSRAEPGEQSNLLYRLAFKNNDYRTCNDLYCTPGRALYTVNNTYVSNILRRNITTTPIAPLINLALPNQNNAIIVPGFTKNHGYGASPADWSAEAIAYYRDLNMMTILDTMFFYLAGRFVVDSEKETDDTSDDGRGGGAPIIENVDAGTSGALNGTIISSTPLNTAFSHYTPDSSANPSFLVTQDSLNALLQNITLSTSLSYSFWSTTANTSIHTTQNIYKFTQPLNLIIPYFLSLFLSLPFIFLGLWALVKNGVSAGDASFTQLLCTTSSQSSSSSDSDSSSYHNHSAGNTLRTLSQAACLGNPQSLSQPLKDLRVRYGELRILGSRDANSSIAGHYIRRAGFGLESEVLPLVKGERYGVMV